MDHQLVSAFLGILSSLSPCFTAPTFDVFRIVVTGWVLHPGRRTVTNVVRAAGAVEGGRSFCVFHRFFSRARWEPDEVGRRMALLVVRLFMPSGTIMASVDDTLGRKRGRRIWGAAFHFDPVRSSRNRRFFSFGHSWVVLSLQAPIPALGGKVFARPVLFRLYRKRRPKRPPGRPRGESKRTGDATEREYRTRPELAVEMLEILGGWLEGREIRLTADSEYAGGSVLGSLPGNVHHVSRMLMNAALYEPAPKRRAGARGAPRKKGARLPSPRELAASRRRRWKPITVRIYGRKVRVKVKAVTCLWYRAARTRPVRVVVVRDPSGRRKDDCFFTTDVRMSAGAVLEAYALRWPPETCFHDVKQSLGFEDPQNRVRRAVERTAPMAMVIHTMVVVWYGRYGHRRAGGLVLRGPWYRTKRSVSFADMLAALRVATWDERVFDDPGLDAGSRKVLEPLREWLRAAA